MHIVGPEQGITQPGTTIACGDSHTSTHGAFGAIAFGIGTTQIRDVLATQTMALGKLKVRRIEVRRAPAARASTPRTSSSTSSAGSGVNGGTGYAYEYAGEVFDRFSMEERMTVCNMSIEGGARAGYVNPDETTFAYLRGAALLAQGAALGRGRRALAAVAATPGAPTTTSSGSTRRTSRRRSPGASTPGRGSPINGRIPDPGEAAEADERASIEEALAYMKLEPGAPIKGTRIDVAFLGSCTNGRLSDFQEVARYIKGRRVAPGVKAIASRVPGRALLCAEAGIDKVFRDAGFEWRAPAARCAWP